MKRFLSVFTFICAVLVARLAAHAAPGDIGVGIKAGTLGGGLEATIGLASGLNARLGVNYLNFSSSETVNEVDYDLDLDFGSVALFLDWHPFNGIFRLTGGAMFNGNEMELSGRPSSAVSVGDHRYTASQVGAITGTMEFDGLAPYLGIGWSSVHPQEKGWGIALDLGVLFQGSPTLASLRADGTARDNPLFQEDLQKEKAKIEDDIDGYRYYPVVSVMATYKF